MVNVAAILLILGVVPLVVGSVRGPDPAQGIANAFWIGVISCVLVEVVLGGRNWARITATLLTVLTFFGGLVAVVEVIAAGSLSGGELFRLFLLAAALIALLGGVVLLYIPAANAYFAQSQAYRAGQH